MIFTGDTHPTKGGSVKDDDDGKPVSDHLVATLPYVAPTILTGTCVFFSFLFSGLKFIISSIPTLGHKS